MKKLLLLLSLVLVKTLCGQQPKLMLPVGHTDNITKAVFSPHSKYLATSSSDKTVKVWDARSGKLLLDLNKFLYEVKSVIFSPDGHKLLTLLEDNNYHEVQIWDSKTGKLLSDSIKGTFVEFSPDGKMIFAFNAGKFTIWNDSDLLRTATIDLTEINPHSDEGYCILSPDNKKLVTVSGRLTSMITYIWDIPNHKFIGELGESFIDIGRMRDPEFSADGSTLITHPNDSSVKVWNTSNGELLYEMKMQDQELTKATLDMQGQTLYTNWKSKYETTTRLIDLKTKKMITEIAQISNTASFSEDRRKFATYSNEEVSFLNMTSGKLLSKVKHDDSAYLYFGLFTPNSNNFLTVLNNSTMQLSEVSSGKTLFNVKINSFTSRPGFSKDGKFIYMANKGKGEIWSATTGKLLTTFDEVNSNVMLSSNGNSLFSWERQDFATYLEDCKLFRIGKPEAISNFKGHVSIIPKNAIHTPDGKKLLLLDSSMISAWDAIEGKFLYNLAPAASFNPWNGLSFSQDEKKLIDIEKNNTYVWNIENGSLVADANAVTKETNEYTYSNGEKFLVRPESDSTKINVWDIKSGKLTTTLNGHSGKVIYTRISPDGSKIATASNDSTAKVWDINDGRLLVHIKAHTDKVNSVEFSHNSKKIITTSDDSTSIIWDISSSKILKQFNLDEKLQYAAFSPDDKKQLYILNNRLYVSYKDKYPFEIGDINYFFPVFDKTSSKIISASKDGAAFYFTAREFERYHEILYSDSSITGTPASVSARVNKFLTLKNSMVYVYDLNKVKQQFSLVLLDSTDYVAQTPAGYYKCSPNAAKLLNYVTSDLKTISFEQLDIKYNRPDLVLEAMESPDTTLIKSYKKAWQKRIKKLGFDTAFFNSSLHVPDADFQNRDSVAYEQASNVLLLKIKAKDDSLILDRCNIWINDVPLFGVRGISLKDKNTNTLDTTIKIILSNGDNHIACSVTNIGGLESYHIPLEVTCKVANPVKEKLYFIGIGIDQFNDSKYNLSWSVKDIRDLAKKFKVKYGSACLIDTLFNKDVSIEKVKALKQNILASSENDKVIIAYSGHGLLNDSLDYFLSTYNVNFHKPEIGGLPYESLESLLDSIPARKKLLLIDACHSGEVDKEELTKMAAVQKDLDPEKKGVIVFADPANKKIGIKNSFELMQELFVNVGKSTGATIISAASGTQFALERGDLKNGVFSYSILEAMEKNSSLKLSHLKKVVSERVKELTKGLQKPTFRTETLDFDWEIW